MVNVGRRFRWGVGGNKTYVSDKMDLVERWSDDLLHIRE